MEISDPVTLTDTAIRNQHTSKLTSQIEIIYERVFSNKGGYLASPWEVLSLTLGASVMLLSSSVDTWNSQDRLSTDTYNVVNNTKTSTEVTA